MRWGIVKFLQLLSQPCQFLKPSSLSTFLAQAESSDINSSTKSVMKFMTILKTEKKSKTNSLLKCERIESIWSKERLYSANIDAKWWSIQKKNDNLVHAIYLSLYSSIKMTRDFNYLLIFQITVINCHI